MCNENDFKNPVKNEAIRFWGYTHVSWIEHLRQFFYYTCVNTERKTDGIVQRI